MNTLLVIDDRFGVTERAMLRRLSVGLADEGVSVILLCSPGVEPHLAEGVLGKVIAAPVQSPLLVRPFARRRAMEALLLAGVTGADVVHAMGGGAWSLAGWLAESFESPIVLDAWRSGVAPRARRMLEALGPYLPSTLVVTPGAPMTEEMRAAGVPGLARTVPWGVHAPRELTERKSRPVRTIGFVGRGADARSYHVAFDAACRIVASRPDTMLVADAETARRLGLWGRARGAGVAERLTLVADLESRRGAALSAEVLVHPESRGEHRSVLLDAMGAGTPVVAAQDPTVTWLVDRVTVTSVAQGDGPAWEAAITTLLDDPEARRAQTEAALRYVREHHTASGHVAGIIDGYEMALRGGAEQRPAAA